MSKGSVGSGVGAGRGVGTGSGSGAGVGAGDGRAREERVGRDAGRHVREAARRQRRRAADHEVAGAERGVLAVVLSGPDKDRATIF